MVTDSRSSRCLRLSSSAVSCGSHWKGVKGLGTKQETLTDTLIPFPLGLSGLR